MRTLLCVISAIMLSACGTVFPPSQLEPPASALLKSPKPLVPPKEGDDLAELHAALRRQYITETNKYVRLQRYVRTILGK